MYVENVKLKNYRNYHNENINLKNGMNIIVGDNFEGKTNLLESIYLLSTTRSHRTDEDTDFINLAGGDFASIEGSVKYQNGRDKLCMIVHKNGKTLIVNNTTVRRNSEFIGKINAVIFSPADMSFFQDAPKVRRRFLDMELGKLSNAYMYNLSSYIKCLKERNAYLKSGNVDKVMLETYTEMLYQPQIRIIKERARLVKYLNAYLSYFYNQLCGTNDSKLVVSYNSFIDEKEDERVMLTQLKESYNTILERDIALRQTNIGINREDLTFYLNGLDISRFSSQGQKRMAILALKLSIVQIIYQIKHEYPILLLDDVFSELDRNHRTCLLRLLPTTVQSIITTTDIEELDFVDKRDVNIVNVKKGKVG